LDIRLRQKAALKTGYVDVSQSHMNDIGQRYAVRAGAADILKQKSVQRFLRRNLRGVHERWAVPHAHVAESKISAQRIASRPLHRIIRRVGVAGADQIDAEKTAAGNIEVVAKYILNDTRPPDAR